MVRAIGISVPSRSQGAVGSYDVTLKFDGDYDGEIVLKEGFAVTAFDLSECLDKVSLNPATFTGYALTPYDAEVGDVTWTGKPYNPYDAWNKTTNTAKDGVTGYTMKITGKGNYTGSVDTTEAQFKVNQLDLTGTKLQFRNTGDPTWYDGAYYEDGKWNNFAADDENHELFRVALDAEGQAVPPEVRPVAYGTAKNEIKTIKDASGEDMEHMIPATVYTAPAYNKNDKAGVAPATIDFSADKLNFKDGTSVSAAFQVVGADQTPAGQSYSIELTKDSATYTGKYQDPLLKVYQTLSDGTKKEASPSDYTVYVSNKSDEKTADSPVTYDAITNGAGTVAGVKAGTAQITIKAAAAEAYKAAEKVITVTVTEPAVNQVVQTITASGVTVTVGKTATIKALTSGDGELSFASSDTSIATVNAKTGVVTGVKAGFVVITVSAAATNNYLAASKDVIATVNAAAAPVPAAKKANTMKVSVSKGAKKKAAIKAKVSKQAKVSGIATVKSAKGKVTVANVSKNKLCKAYKVMYKSGKINLVVPKGKAQEKITRQVKIKVTAAGNATFKAGTKTINVYVKGVK